MSETKNNQETLTDLEPTETETAQITGGFKAEKTKMKLNIRVRPTGGVQEGQEGQEEGSES